MASLSLRVARPRPCLVRAKERSATLPLVGLGVQRVGSPASRALAFAGGGRVLLLRDHRADAASRRCSRTGPVGAALPRVGGAAPLTGRAGSGSMGVSQDTPATPRKEPSCPRSAPRRARAPRQPRPTSPLRSASPGGARRTAGRRSACGSCSSRARSSAGSPPARARRRQPSRGRASPGGPTWRSSAPASRRTPPSGCWCRRPSALPSAMLPSPRSRPTCTTPGPTCPRSPRRAIRCDRPTDAPPWCR